jgi:hypothetical protein
MIYDFKKFEESMRVQNFQSGNNYSIDLTMIALINKYVNTDDIKLLYPKNLFVKDKNSELYVFTDDKLIYTRSNGQKEDYNPIIQLNIVKIEDIKSLQVSESNDYSNPTSLSIYFKNNDEELTFNSSNDTNIQYSNSFKEDISEISKYLIGKL